jgi:hypothetical protein
MLSDDNGGLEIRSEIFYLKAPEHRSASDDQQFVG